MKRFLLVVGVVTFLVGFALLDRSSGQAQSPAPANLEPNSLLGTYPAAGQAVYPPMRASPAQTEVNKLMKQLRETEDEAKKGELTKQLEAAVAKLFDEDLKARETELTKLEERLKKLRAQLDRRSKAKDEIIKLQIKVLQNEAEGLGFQGSSSFDEGGRFHSLRTIAPVPRSVPALPPDTSTVPRR
jgi:hypothetical protein